FASSAGSLSAIDFRSRTQRATRWSRRTGSTACACRRSSCASSTARCDCNANLVSMTTWRVSLETVVVPIWRRLQLEMRKNVLIVGAGGVAQVVAHKCAQHNDVLGDIHIASRTVSKCEAILASVREKKSLKVPGKLEAHALDAMNVAATIELIKKTNSQIVINVGSAFVNMTVLQACIETGAAYLDTAIHEDPLKICETPPWYANYEWKRRDICKEKGITAILGVGFDPGVVNAYAALAREDYLDKIDSIDIVDVNAGSHGRYFATHFDPEINFREFTGQVRSWQNGQWTSNRMFEVKKVWDLPVVGESTTYMTGHDEIHSLSRNFDVPHIRFWMGFGDHYINVFTVLKNLGLLSEQPIQTADGQPVV